MVNLVITNNKQDPLSRNRSSQHAKSCLVHPAGNFWGIFRCFLADAESTGDPSPIVACAFSPDFSYRAINPGVFNLPPPRI